MRAHYLPAIPPDQCHDRWGLNPIHWLDERIRDTSTWYPHFLMSAAEWRCRVSLESEGWVVADSGGYQLATREGIELAPVDVMRWQLESGADFGPVLDSPPISRNQNAPTNPSARFRFCLNLTVLYTEAALVDYLEARDRGAPFRWWGVAHGASREEMEKWYGRITDLYPFDDKGEGWCFRPQPHGARGVARILGFCRDHGIQRAHIFVPGGASALATLLVLGPRAGLDRLTFDSATPMRVGNSRVLFIPHPDGLGWGQRVERFRDTGGKDRGCRDYMLEHCSCMSCRWLRDDVLRTPREVTDEYLKHRFRFHNVLTVLSTFRRLEEEVEVDPDGLLRVMLGVEGRERVLREFEQRSPVGV